MRRNARSGNRKQQFGVKDYMPQVYQPIGNSPRTIKNSPMIELWVALRDTSASGTWSVSNDNLHTAIRNAVFSGATASYHYVVRQMEVWASAGASTQISITDASTGVVGSDAGSYSERAKVGIRIPPSKSLIMANSATGTLASGATSPDELDYELDVLVLVYPASASPLG